jgi:hypothetical protein
MYLPERVLRQFGHVQSIPHLPRESAVSFTAQAIALTTASVHFAGYRDRVLTTAQRGQLAIDSWYAAPGYMRWYFKISHPYMTPLPRGDPPRPCEREAIMEEQAELAGPLATRLEGNLTEIQGIADEILACGELAEDSYVLAEVRRIIRLSTFYAESYQRKGGGPAMH